MSLCICLICFQPSRVAWPVLRTHTRYSLESQPLSLMRGQAMYLLSFPFPMTSARVLLNMYNNLSGTSR
uniref:Putative secreted protein n=1 Tax=Anopheles marajoara TaxID=58244 RepID=A0A2M4CEP1_9DIPT